MNKQHQLAKLTAMRNRRTLGDRNSWVYRTKLRKNRYIPFNIQKLMLAEVHIGQRLELNSVVIYDEIHPVKIIGGFNEQQVIVQFLDRIDTPICRVSTRKLWSGVAVEPRYTQFEKDLQEVFGEDFQQPEPVNTFEEEWW